MTTPELPEVLPRKWERLLTQICVAGFAGAVSLISPVAGVAAGAATAANAFVYPFALPFYETTWQLASATFFAVGLALTAWLAVQATRRL